MTGAGELIHQHIVVDPDIMAGKPRVRGTRIPVELVLKRLSQDLDLDSLIVSYPRHTVDDVRACVAYAQALVAGEEIIFAEPIPA